MSCKTIANLTEVIKTTSDPYLRDVAKSTIAVIKDIDEDGLQSLDIEMLNWLVDGLVESGYDSILGDIHSDPDCAICVALSARLRSKSAAHCA